MPFELFFLYIQKIEHGEIDNSTWYKFNTCLKTLLVDPFLIQQERIPELEWWRNVFFGDRYSLCFIREREKTCHFLFGKKNDNIMEVTVFDKGLLAMRPTLNNNIRCYRN